MPTLTQTKLANFQERNQYGELNLSYAEAIAACYPKLKIKSASPGCWGSTGEIDLRKSPTGWTVIVPSGKYKSSKHRHSSYTGIMAVESSRKKLNLPACPLILLATTAYNGDYRSLKKSYFLLGQNEDSSYFVHKIRPRIARQGDLDAIRVWMWQLKKGETVAARQGDLAFIAKQKPSGNCLDERVIAIGNHTVLGEEVRMTKHKIFALNPTSSHREHVFVRLKGWFELRLAKVWAASTAD